MGDGFHGMEKPRRSSLFLGSVALGGSNKVAPSSIEILIFVL